MCVLGSERETSKTDDSSESTKKASARATLASGGSDLVPGGGSNALGEGREERPIPSQSSATAAPVSIGQPHDPSEERSTMLACSQARRPFEADTAPNASRFR